MLTGAPNSRSRHFMAQKGNIIIPSGFKPVHSFDLWGVIVDQNVLGEHKIDIYKEVSRAKNVPEDEIKQVVEGYQALLDGKSWATGPRKSEIIDAINGPMLMKEFQRYYASTFMQDALSVMKEILDGGEGIIIFTSIPAPGVMEQFPSNIRERMGEIRYGKKTDPEAFKVVYNLEAQLGNRIVTHTADELPELIAARKSRLFQPGGLIYINRNDSNSEHKIKSEGIDHYVNDLREVKYNTLVTMEH